MNRTQTDLTTAINRVLATDPEHGRSHVVWVLAGFLDNPHLVPPATCDLATTVLNSCAADRAPLPGGVS